MTTMTCERVHPSAPEALAFLADYVSWLLGCGATCMRLEKNVGRMAASLGLSADISILPGHINMSLHDGSGAACVTTVTTVKRIPVSFDMNTQLSELSWQLADGQIDFGGARRRLEEIKAAAGSGRSPAVLCAVALANAAFCRLFGGDWAAMCVVAVATAAGFWLRDFMLGHRCDNRVVWTVCAFVSAVIACAGLLFGLGDTPAIALGTSVLYLVPGIPFINSFSDMLNRHYICALSRLTDALILTCCLSAGLCAAMMLMHVGMY